MAIDSAGQRTPLLRRPNRRFQQQGETTVWDELYQAGRQTRRRVEPDAYLNLAFYAGKQWTAWDGGRVHEPALEDWREQVVDNRIRPFIRNEIAKMTKTRPKFVGVPNTQSDADVAAARYAEDLLEDTWHRLDLVRKLRAVLLWSRVTPAGFWKVWWDPTIGPAREVLTYADGHPDAGRSIKDGYGAPITDVAALPEGMGPLAVPKMLAPGDLCIEVRSFFEIVVDPHAGEEGLGSADWIAEEAVYSKEWVRKHFPGAEAELDFDTTPTAGVLESRMPLGGAYEDFIAGGEAKGVALRELWSADKHVVWSRNGQVLLDEANPYGILPYVMFSGIPMPGRFWPDSVVTDLRPRQTDLNKRLSQIAENAERIANPPLMVPSSVGDDFQWNGLAGEIVEFNDTGSPNAMPTFLPVPEVPGYVQTDVDRIVNSMMEISGQHEVSGAQVPAGVTAASAISLLQEQDDTRLGPDVGDMEKALADAGTIVLLLAKRYFTEQRHLRVAGDDGRWNIVAFTGDRARGAESIRVQTGSGMPENKAARQAAIQQVATLFAQNGQPISERAWRKILSEFQVGGLEQFFASQARDEQQVAEENRKIALGAGLSINSFDDDEAHIAGHTDFCKTAAYGTAPDKVKAIMEQHLLEHRMRLMQMTNPPGPEAPQPGIMPSSSGNGQTPPVPSAPTAP